MQMIQPVEKPSQLIILAGSLLPAVKLLRKNDPLRLAGATAFFTTFALPPIVFILAQLFGLLTEPKMIGRGLIENLGSSLGQQGAEQVKDVIFSIFFFDVMVVFPKHMGCTDAVLACGQQ